MSAPRETSRARHDRHRPVGRAGRTLLELILAVGLLSVLVAGLLQMIDTALTVWQRTETRRDAVQVASAAADLLAADLAAVDGGPRGDLLVEWVPFDTDGDGKYGAKGPRVRLVRPASAAERRRLAGPSEAWQGHGLVEVIWAWLPGGGLAPADPAKETADPAAGVLWRGLRLVDGPGVSVFDEAFLDARGRPPAERVEAVTGGVLWCAPLFATQTTLLDGGWELGRRLEHATASWDAWTRGRPSVDDHAWNERAAGVPDAEEDPVLPRLVRVELELERPRDVRRRPTLAAPLEREGGAVEVRNAHRLPPPGTHLLVGEEWVRLLSVSGSSARVERARRGTGTDFHEKGAVLHFGTRIVREARVVHHREDWNL